MAHDVDILIELKKVQNAQEECTKKLSELDEYKFRVLSLENKVKDLQDAVKDLESENKELVSEIHRYRLEHDRRQTSELNVNNYESNRERAVEGFPSVDDRRVLNSTHLLQGAMKKNDDRIRSVIKRSFITRPKPTNPGPTKPGHPLQKHIGFTAGVSIQNLENLATQQTIVFDKAITNIGNAYDPLTGIFTAPAKGAYVFTLTMTVRPDHVQYLDLVVDGVKINYISAGPADSYDYASTTKQWILELNNGSEVWFRTQTTKGNYRDLHGHMNTILSGFLLFQTE